MFIFIYAFNIEWQADRFAVARWPGCGVKCGEESELYLCDHVIQSARQPQQRDSPHSGVAVSEIPGTALLFYYLVLFVA